MNTPMMWFLLANIGFAVLWCFYRLFLHRDTFFTGKRFTLLLGLLFTLIYPLLNVAWHEFDNSYIPALNNSLFPSTLFLHLMRRKKC